MGRLCYSAPSAVPLMSNYKGFPQSQANDFLRAAQRLDSFLIFTTSAASPRSCASCRSIEPGADWTNYKRSSMQLECCGP